MYPTGSLKLQNPKIPLQSHLCPILVQIMPSLVPHKHATKRKQSRIYSTPSKQNPEIQTDAAVQPEDYLSTAFDDVVQGPGVAPAVEDGFDRDVVEGCGDVCDYPED